MPPNKNFNWVNLSNNIFTTRYIATKIYMQPSMLTKYFCNSEDVNSCGAYILNKYLFEQMIKMVMMMILSGQSDQSDFAHHNHPHNHDSDHVDDDDSIWSVTSRVILIITIITIIMILITMMMMIPSGQ